MARSLDYLLRRIDPQQSLDRMERRAHEAFARYRVPRGPIHSHRQLRHILGHFEFHLTKAFLGGQRHFPLNQGKRWYQRVHKRLVSKYGQRPEDTVMAIARSGKEGGLYAVLRAIADHFAYEQARAYIREKVDRFWDSLTMLERKHIIAMYYRRYKHLLPDEVKGPRDWRLRADFKSILRRHPEMVRSRRRVGDAASFANSLSTASLR